MCCRLLLWWHRQHLPHTCRAATTEGRWYGASAQLLFQNVQQVWGYLQAYQQISHTFAAPTMDDLAARAEHIGREYHALGLDSSSATMTTPEAVSARWTPEQVRERARHGSLVVRRA